MDTNFNKTNVARKERDNGNDVNMDGNKIEEV